MRGFGRCVLQGDDRWKKTLSFLAGGFNPFEKYYCSQNGNLPQIGMKIKVSKTTTQFLDVAISWIYRLELLCFLDIVNWHTKKTSFSSFATTTLYMFPNYVSKCVFSIREHAWNVMSPTYTKFKRCIASTNCSSRKIKKNSNLGSAQSLVNSVNKGLYSRSLVVIVVSPLWSRL